MVTQTTKLEESFCMDQWNQLCVKYEKDGLKYMIPWTSDTIMVKEMVDALLNDMGVGEDGSITSSRCRAAVKEYCIQIIDGFNEDGMSVTMGELDQLACAFSEGYQVCAKEI